MNTKTNNLQSDVISEILQPTKWQWLILLWVGQGPSDNVYKKILQSGQGPILQSGQGPSDNV